MDPAVLTGIFGLAGVVVGGSVTGWANRESENRRVIAAAVAAARLVHLELYGMKAKLRDAVEDEGHWRWVPEPPLTPVLDAQAGILAPVMTTDEWGKLATVVVQCRFSEPLIALKQTLARRRFDELHEDHPEWTTANDIDDEDKEILGRITQRIDTEGSW